VANQNPGDGQLLDRGPEAYENWKAFERGELSRHGQEFPLYSDAELTGEVEEGCGPYQIFNTIADGHPRRVMPVLVLRATYHGENRLGYAPKLMASDTLSYHGGRLPDEVAAIVGLALGIRLRASSETRDFELDSGRERPRAENPSTVPVLVRSNASGEVLPKMSRIVAFSAEALKEYIRLTPPLAVALSRAALLHQHALWLAESNPSDAWLMLVSAVEVAAVAWRRQDDDVEQVFRRLKPKWVARLERSGDAGLVRDMAAEWTDLLGATNRFVKFLVEHFPDPPRERPSVNRFEWTLANARTAFQKIYEHRSHALHAGMPFPAPLCVPAVPMGPEQPPVERPFFLASTIRGGTWLVEDLPMYLHVFEYIVRNALTKWWQSLVSADTATATRTKSSPDDGQRG
jgi:hypothetical protein